MLCDFRQCLGHHYRAVKLVHLATNVHSILFFSVSLLGEAGERGGGEAGSRGQSRLAGLAGQLRSPYPPPHSITMIPILILNRGGVPGGAGLWGGYP